MHSRYTIFVPTYNGGALARACIESVLNQTHPDWRLCVLDDASTDGTREWVAGIRDPRVQVIASEKNLGIAGNWARIAQAPKDAYLAIIGQDDLLDPNYLEVMDRLIAKHPDASLYHAHFRFLDEKSIATPARPMPERETAAEYVAALFSGRRDTHGSGYLMPSALYDEIGGIPLFPKLLFADDALWISLMQRSYKACAPEECFTCRRHRGSVGHSASAQDWIAAMPHYARFLTWISNVDRALGDTIREYAPSYFLNFARIKYNEAVVAATREDKIVSPDVESDLLAVLLMVTGHITSNTLAAPRGLRLRIAINRSTPLRRMHRRYLRLRDSQP